MLVFKKNKQHVFSSDTLKRKTKPVNLFRTMRFISNETKRLVLTLKHYPKHLFLKCCIVFGYCVTNYKKTLRFSESPKYCMCHVQWCVGIITLTYVTLASGLENRSVM